MRFFRSHKSWLAILLLVGILIPILPVSAQEASAPSTQSPSGAAYAISVPAFAALIFVLKAFGIVARFFEFVLTIPINLSVVEPMWKIVRDFTNMFFILILVVMAFATIFDVGGYQLNAQLLTRLVVVAVLINFSLVLAILFIDGINVVNHALLRGIGSIGDRFAMIFNAEQLLGGSGRHFVNLEGCFVQNNVFSCVKSVFSYSDAVTWQIAFQILFSLILAIIAFVSFLFPTVFAFIRIPFLWFLVIFTPLASASNILPATKELWSRWTKEFFAWSLYLPAYLFFLYFGLFFLAQQNAVIARLNASFPNASFWQQTVLDLPYSFQFLFFYIVAAIVLWLSTSMALAVSRTGGTYAQDWGIKGSQWAVNNIPFLSPAYRGVRQGAEDRFAQVRQEGLRIPFTSTYLGGAQSAAQKQAQMAQKLGVAGAKEAQMAKQVDYFKKKLDQENFSNEQLRELLNSSRMEERIAAYQVLKDRKDLDGEELLTAYNTMRKNVGRASATRLIQGTDFAKDLSKRERSLWYLDADLNKSGDYAVLRRVAKAMATEGELGIDYEVYDPNTHTGNRYREMQAGRNALQKAAELFAGKDEKTTNQMRYDFIMEAAKKKPVEAFRTLRDLNIKDPRDDKLFDEAKVENTLYENIRRRSVEDWLPLLNSKIFTDDPHKITKDEITLKNLLIRVAGEDPKILGRIRANQKSSADNRKAVQEIEKILSGQKAGNPTPPGGAGGTTVRAEISNSNVIDLRNT